VVGRRGGNFGVEKRWKKYIYAGKDDGIFVHLENNLNRVIRNWCIGGYWFIPAAKTQTPLKPSLLRQVIAHLDKRLHGLEYGRV
jgi:hypothetical protein